MHIARRRSTEITSQEMLQSCKVKKGKYVYRFSRRNLIPFVYLFRSLRCT